MSPSPKSIIVYIYNSYKDPLFQGLLFSYLKEIARTTDLSFHIITYEQEKYALSFDEINEEKKELKRLNIFWYPLKYHSGNVLLLKKTYDFVLGLFLVVKLKITKRSKAILAFTNIAGSVGYLISQMLNLKFIVYSYEPHSEFLADFNLWSRQSFKFKILNFFETKMGKEGDYIITGTKHMVERLNREGAKGKIYRVPSCVNQEKFKYNAGAEEEIRSRFNVGSRKCLIYVGKFGDLYYKEEVVGFFRILINSSPDFFFLIVTPDDKNEINQLFIDKNIDPETYAITYSPYEHVQDYISAADIGLIAIKPSPSQKYRSPVKTGEYLMCGKPYIVCEGVSEDDLYAIEYNVGIVVESFAESHVVSAIPKINELLQEDRDALSERCRETGIAYRGMEQAMITLRTILSEI